MSGSQITRRIEAGQLTSQSLQLDPLTKIEVKMTHDGRTFGSEPMTSHRLAIMWDRNASSSCDPISIEEALAIADMLVEMSVESLLAAGFSADGVLAILGPSAHRRA